MDGRIRLRQWLEGRLNSGYIPGLLWLDKAKAIFKIPWKHHSKHTWQEDDAAIFKDWAVVTGRFREGLDVPDWPMWKTRLRCALNKAPDIQEVRQHHNLHCDEPFKVYRFISKTESMWRANASRHASLIFDGVPCGGPGNALASAAGGGMPQFFSSQSSGLSTARLAKGNSHQSAVSSSNNCTTNNSGLNKASLGGCGGGGALKPTSSKPITLIQKTEHGIIKLKCINIPVLQHAPNNAPQNTPHNTPQPLRSSFIGCRTPQPPSTACQLLSRRQPPSLGRRYKLEMVLDEQDELGRQTQSQSQHSRRTCITAAGPASTTSSGVPVALSTDSSAANCLHSPLEAGALSAGQKIRLSDVMEPEMHQICLRIQHLDQRVCDMIVNNPNGCCIYFGRFDENLSTVGPEPIEPQIYQFVADCNRYCVDMLLDNMQRGVVLSIGSDGSIYAEKLCKCATFVYRPAAGGGTGSGTSSSGVGDFLFVDKLARRDKMMIFDFRAFLEQLHYFQRGLAERPHVELILAFGQQIKERASPDSLYVWCRLASCKAWFLLQRAISNQSRPVLGSCRRLCSQSPLGYGAVVATSATSPAVGSVRRAAAAVGDHDGIFITGGNGAGEVLLRRSLCNEDDDVDDDLVREDEQQERTRALDSVDDGLETGAMGELIEHEQEGGPDRDQDQDQEEEEEEEEGLVDHMIVYGDNCLSDELGLIGVAHEVSIENAAVADEFPSSLRHHPHAHGGDQDEQQQQHSLFRHQTRFEFAADLSYHQFDSGSNYEYK